MDGEADGMVAVVASSEEPQKSAIQGRQNFVAREKELSGSAEKIVFFFFVKFRGLIWWRDADLPIWARRFRLRRIG